MYNIFLTHPQDEITKPTLGFKFTWSEVFEKKIKIDKIQAGNNEITTTKLRFCLGPQYSSMPLLRTQMQDKLSGFPPFPSEIYSSSVVDGRQANHSSSSLHRPSFNSLLTPCHSSYLLFGALALTVANNTAHIPSIPLLFFKYLTNLDIGALTLYTPFVVLSSKSS
jgi:hypothetical protein